MPHPHDIALSHLKKLIARDPMLRDVIAETLPNLSGMVGPFSPDVDVFETDDAHIVLVDLPGVTKSSVKVRLEGARLVLEGERPAPTLEGARSRNTERAYGAFKREFLMPTDVEASGVTASLDDGVLTVTVPRVRKGTGPALDIPVTVD